MSTPQSERATVARYLSKYPNYTLEVFKPVTTILTGEMGPYRDTVDVGYIARFRQGGLTEREREQAKQRFQEWRGAYEGEDVMQRVSIFDLNAIAFHEGWDADKKAAAEKRLDENQGEDYFKVEEERAAKPWPSYDETDPERVVVLAREMGIDLALVAAYELENEGRDEVLETIEAFQPA
jgi:hypothetical protein